MTKTFPRARWGDDQNVGVRNVPLKGIDVNLRLLRRERFGRFEKGALLHVLRALLRKGARHQCDSLHENQGKRGLRRVVLPERRANRLKEGTGDRISDIGFRYVSPQGFFCIVNHNFTFLRLFPLC